MAGEDQPEGGFSPDEPFTDGRPQWDWTSKYGTSAWVQIGIEGLFLISLLLLSLFALAITAAASASLLAGDKAASPPPSFVLSADLIVWVAVALGGLCGGCAFSLKWLYHAVSNGKWHRDRVVWRVVVPLLASTLALFTALMVGSGLLPIFSRTVFDNWRIGSAFGFFVGFFSDNLVASLQRFAAQVFGTLESSSKRKR